MATTGDIRRVKTPKLKLGARLVRDWGGVTHEVTVTDGGFLWCSRQLKGGQRCCSRRRLN